MNSLISLWTFVAETSLRAGVLIAAVFALRWVLRGRVPAQCFHWLWIIVAIRLLLPAAPASATSIYNLLAREEREPVANGPAWVAREEPGAAVARTEPQEGVARGAYLQAEAPHAKDPTTPAVQLPRLLALAWLGGILAHIVLLGRSAWRMRDVIRQATPITDPRLLALANECAQRLGIRRLPELRETSSLGGPALVGLWHPRVILPSRFAEILTEEEARFVLLHELAHLQRRDLFALWLLTLARVIHWFNPLTWLAARAARIDAELACDESLLRRTGATEAVAYGETLLKLTQLTAWRQPVIPVVAIAEGSRAMRLRLQGIAAFTGPSRWRTAVALAIVLGTSCIFAADETAKSPEGRAPATAGIGVVETVAADSPELIPNWARDWSIVHVTAPAEGKPGKIIARARDGRQVTLHEGKPSSSEPWLEKLDGFAAAGEVRWKASIRKGGERTELWTPAGAARQVEIHATFLETNDTTIRRLRLKAPRDKGAGLRVLDDALRGRETDPVLTAAEGSELAETLTGTAGATNLSGSTVLAGPRVTTRPGNRAVIEIIREFRYPTGWHRDEQKQIWVPKGFETRNTGVTLEAEPVITADGAIAIKLIPQVVEFLGWKNVDTGKGIPKPVVKGNRDGNENPRLADLLGPMPVMGNAENPAWRCVPVFSARKITVEPVLQSGEMYVCAGLPETEDVAPFKSPAASTRVVALITVRFIAPPEPLRESFPPLPAVPPNAGRYVPDRKVEDFLFGTAAEKQRAAAAAPPPSPTRAEERLPGFRAAGDAAGFLRSPYAPASTAIDVRGLPPGTEVKCVTTGRTFLVPVR